MKIFLSIFKLFPPELSHSIALNSLNILYKLKLLSFFKPKIKNKNYELFGLNFKNKLGTAAGLDKNGDFINCLGGLGFGFLEVGTVTPLPQTGNPKPRVFRLFKEQAVINRLGFNNKGVDHLVKNLKKRIILMFLIYIVPISGSSLSGGLLAVLLLIWFCKSATILFNN